jgi:hypothetical protein
VLDIEKKLGNIKNHFKSIYAVNVLEHIKDDVQALKNMNMLLEKDGYIAILVPAKKMAFTRLDESLGHYRRYEKEELRKKIEKANLKVEKIDYFNMLGLVSWLIRDRVSRNEAHLDKNQVKVFDGIVPFLEFVEPRKKLPFGISLIAVARKK